MADVVIENPILNSPFEEPERHFRFTDEGITDEVVEARRISSYFVPIPAAKKRGGQLVFDTEWTRDRIEENRQINRIRERVSQWRKGGHAGNLTSTTRRLLAYWSESDREKKLFFCQIEALETAIYLTEAAREFGDTWMSASGGGCGNLGVVLRRTYAVARQAGYAGSYTTLKAYVRPQRALRPSRATVRFETPPGRQLQSDWGQVVVPIAGVETEVHFIVNTLGYSRRMHVWASDSEDAEHTFEGLVRAFEYFGGVTDEVLVDNQKCAVLEHRVGQEPRFHRRFLDLAGQYGFRPRACKPGRAQTKGKDERMVGYVKSNFFVRYRAFESWAHLNQQLEQWLKEEADPRVHGTVREVVAERFAREVPHLGPLPKTRFDTAYAEMRQASWDAYVEARGNRYSVPDRYAGQVVPIRITLEGELVVYDADQVIVTHRLQDRSQGWVTVPGHHTALWQRTLNVERRPLADYAEASSWN